MSRDERFLKERNTIWSTYVQSIGTLYYSRSLRFSDEFRKKYMAVFGIDDKEKILEIGCGPGALAESLKRWYPDADVFGIDRDSRFIEFAKTRSSEIVFEEGDATNLSFPDESFDVVISNTVAEHIEPSKFYKEQYRVLKENGICLVLSARRGIDHCAPCICEETELEKEIWGRVDEYVSKIHEKYKVRAYPQSEMELPMYMEKYGFQNVSTEYITINLTPDNPIYSRQTAHSMINANRQSQIDHVDSLKEVAPGVVSESEREELKHIIHKKFDKRIELYDKGIKQWDSNVSVTMIVRGVKA